MISLPARVRTALQARVHAIFGHRDYVRFIVLARSRTGSNMLLSMLNSHPRVRADGERFQRLNGACPDAVLADLFAPHPRRIRAVGCKVFYYHPLDGDPEQLMATLQALDRLHVIHLKRRNVLRTMLSRRIAAREDVWQIDRDEERPSIVTRRVRITPQEIEKVCALTRQWEAAGDARFQDHPLLEVFYEDLVENVDREFQRIVRFLGLPGGKPIVQTRRQNPEPLSELIVNYAELKVAFRNSALAPFFDE